MYETVGDMWELWGEAVLVITTSGTVTKRGCAVLGRGCARQAGERLPQLANRLGALLLVAGNHVHLLDHNLVSFPVEETAWSQPDIRLIRRSALELRDLADRQGWSQVILPRPGCGHGGLEWKVVRPLLTACLDDRFTIICAG